MSCVARTGYAHGSARAVRYHIAEADVTVATPEPCRAEGAFVLSAHISSIDAALMSQGMRRTEASGTTQHSAHAEHGEHAEIAITYAFTAVDAEQRYRALHLQRLAKEVDGRALWCVQPLRRAGEGHDIVTCRAAADEPWTLLTQGLAHVSMVPWQTTSTDKSLVAEHGTVLRVDLRHAAGELETGWAAERLVAGAPARDSCTPQDAHAAQPLSLQEIADSVVWHSQSPHKRLALTFDACSTYSYGPFNPEVIAALEAADVPATLFVGGHWAEMHPDTLAALSRNPLFEIGNHTYSHPHMRDLTPWQQAQELRWTQALIYNVTGVVPRMFRPPYGEVDDAMLAEVARAGLTTVEYDLPAGDADVHVSPIKLTKWVVGQASAGSIVIMHMNRPKNHTAQALPMIVKELRQKGFAFCRMGDLLHDGGGSCR